jgi:hypothetical protein
MEDRHSRPEPWWRLFVAPDDEEGDDAGGAREDPASGLEVALGDRPGGEGELDEP